MDMRACVHSVVDVVDELESNLAKFVKIDDVQETLPDVKKCLEKCATFPCPGITGASTNEADDDEPEMALWLLFSEEPISLSRTMSLPLVSAMKGGREKQGIQPRKLNVTWAPDVYDPIPNSQSHTVTVKGKQKKFRKDKDNNHKKNGKKGQRGNHSKGGGGKEKKQSRKFVGRSDKCYRTVDISDKLDDPSDDLGEFHVGSPDYCGSSFLNNSVNNFHYSVAEAL